MQRNNPDYTYLVIYTIFLGWDLFPLDLLWDLLAFGSHLVKKKRNVFVGVGGIRRVGESAGDTDEGSKLELSEGRSNLCASNLVGKNENIGLIQIGNCSDDLYELTEPSVQDL